MLFTTYHFLFVFLPVAVAVWLVCVRINRTLAIVWLIAASLYFHAYIQLWFVVVLVVSMAANYAAAHVLARLADSRIGLRRSVLAAGIAFDLALLAYFKYMNFFLETAGLTDYLFQTVLPVGISFFTFKQIAFLVDCYRRDAADFDPLRFTLFVSFFPYLIAGPIAHHREIMPQLQAMRAGETWQNLAVGLTLLAIGLVKKLVMADGLARGANLVFDGAAEGVAPDLIAAWFGTLCFSFQIYFDFSGYSDMAMGAARLFGLRLPINFASPYKSDSIIDFWRRWHITLSRFLRDYLYVPLGGNRRGPRRRYLNLMVVMVLGGLWHGAGWTFLLWGTLHGGALVVAHLWRRHCAGVRVPRWLGVALTFVFVTLAWVPFRAPDLASTMLVMEGLVGLNGVTPFTVPHLGALIGQLGPTTVFVLIPVTAVWIWALPNTQEWLWRERIGLPTAGYAATVVREARWHWKPSPIYAGAVALGLALAITLVGNESAFIYFQF